MIDNESSNTKDPCIISSDVSLRNVTDFSSYGIGRPFVVDDSQVSGLPGYIANMDGLDLCNGGDSEQDGDAGRIGIGLNNLKFKR
jgi:hypothetical protein